MRACGPRVIVRRPPTEEKIGSIVIPDKYRQVPLEGIVEALGTPSGDLQIGDKVLFGKYTAERVPGHPELAIVWLKDIMVVLE